MKTVIYICNLAERPDDFDEERMSRDLGLDGAETLFTASAEELPSFEPTVQQLIEQGERQVVCIHATLEEDGSIKPFGEPMIVTS